MKVYLVLEVQSFIGGAGLAVGSSCGWGGGGGGGDGG